MRTLFKFNSHLTFEEIQKYLSNELKAETLNEVENHLLDCPLCSGAVEGFRNSKSLGEDKKALKKLEKEIKLKRGKEKTIIMWPLKIAASLVFLLCSIFTVYHLQSNNPVDNYTAVITNEFSLDNRFGSNETAFGKAIDFCENSDFNACVVALNSCIEKDPDNIALKYFLGLAHFQNGAFSESIDNLLLVRNSNSSYYDDAFWYMILAHLKMDDKSEAISLLEEYTINNPKGFYVKDAKKLKFDLE